MSINRMQRLHAKKVRYSEHFQNKYTNNSNNNTHTKKQPTNRVALNSVADCRWVLNTLIVARFALRIKHMPRRNTGTDVRRRRAARSWHHVWHSPPEYATHA